MAGARQGISESKDLQKCFWTYDGCSRVFFRVSGSARRAMGYSRYQTDYRRGEREVCVIPRDRRRLLRSKNKCGVRLSGGC